METTENTDAIQVSSFPLPPAQYYKLFTDENIRNNRAPKPPAPIQGTYQMFGQQFSTEDNIIRPLEAQGFKRLYPQHFDRKKELKKLNHSLLVNFLDLIDLLVHNPDSPQRAEKVCGEYSNETSLSSWTRFSVNCFQSKTFHLG